MSVRLTDTLAPTSVDTSGVTQSHFSPELYANNTFPSIPDAVGIALSEMYGTKEPFASTPSDQTASQSATNVDHRRFPRRTAGGFVSVVPYPADGKLTVEWTNWLMQTSGLTGELVDLSRSGLALLLLQPLAVGDVLVARLSQQESRETLDVIAEVVRVVDVGDQRWKIMTEFASPLEFDDAYEFARHDQDAAPPLFPPSLP